VSGTSGVSPCICVQIDEVLRDREKVCVMEDHVEQLLVAMSMQFKMAYSTHMGDDDTPKQDVIRLYRCLMGTLIAVSYSGSSLIYGFIVCAIELVHYNKV